MVVMMLMLALLVFVMMMSAVRADILFLEKLGSKVSLRLHRGKNLCAGQLIPGRRDNRGILVLLAKQRNTRLKLLLAYVLGTAQKNRMRIFHLVVEELTEVFHVNAAFAGIHNRRKTGNHEVRIVNVQHGLLNVGKLADTGGLNDDAVRMELLLYLHKRFAEISDKRAADAAGIHLGNLDAGLLQKAAVDADFTEFVLDQNNLLAAVTVGKQFLNEGRLSGAQKAGENVNLNHVCPSFLLHFSFYRLSRNRLGSFRINVLFLQSTKRAGSP